MALSRRILSKQKSDTWHADQAEKVKKNEAPCEP